MPQSRLHAPRHILHVRVYVRLVHQHRRVQTLQFRYALLRGRRVCTALSRLRRAVPLPQVQPLLLRHLTILLQQRVEGSLLAQSIVRHVVQNPHIVAKLLLVRQVLALHHVQHLLLSLLQQWGYRHRVYHLLRQLLQHTRQRVRKSLPRISTVLEGIHQSVRQRLPKVAEHTLKVVLHRLPGLLSLFI